MGRCRPQYFGIWLVSKITRLDLSVVCSSLLFFMARSGNPNKAKLTKLA